MLKLNVNQLKQALSLVREINSLERAKDISGGYAVQLPGMRSVMVPVELVRAEIARGLTAAHEKLAALGMEMVPGNEEHAYAVDRALVLQAATVGMVAGSGAVRQNQGLATGVNHGSYNASFGDQLYGHGECLNPGR